MPNDRSTADDSLARRFEEQETRRLHGLIEAVIFASPEPVTTRQLARALGEPEDEMARQIEQVIAEYEKPEHGVFIRKAQGGYQMGTKPAYHEDLQESLRGLRPRPPLSLAALQTLAIIAYKQPVSAPEIQAIRRVKGAGVLETLLKRKLIAPAGRKPDEGYALLYKTTDLFLAEFGFAGLKDLPALEEFAELRQPYQMESVSATGPSS